MATKPVKDKDIITHVTQTVYGSKIALANAFGLPNSVDLKSTLNYKLKVNVSETQSILSTQYPQVEYFCIGNGGHELAVTENGIPVPVPLIHQTTDASPFKMIPFIIREMDNDIPDSQRANYALRTIIEVDRVSYIAYYLRKIDYKGVQPDIMITSIDEHGVKHTVPFVPNEDNLNPTPQKLKTTGVSVLKAEYAEVKAQFVISFDIEQTEELQHVGQILYGDERTAIVSEIGLVAGIEINKNFSLPGIGSKTMKEVIGAQVTSLISCFYSAYEASDGFSIKMVVGSAPPRFVMKDEATRS